MKPEFPLISIYRNREVEIFKKEDSIPTKISVYTILSQKLNEWKVYDRNGISWELSFVNDRVKNNFITRLLANTLYNPTVDVQIVWENLGSYDLIELKNDIATCVDIDDDVITQFEEGDFIKSEVRNAETFDQIITILNKYVFEVDEEKLWKEQDKRRQED